jgi:hypothetical protein
MELLKVLAMALEVQGAMVAANRHLVPVGASQTIMVILEMAFKSVRSLFAFLLFPLFTAFFPPMPNEPLFYYLSWGYDYPSKAFLPISRYRFSFSIKSCMLLRFYKSFRSFILHRFSQKG